MPELQIDPQTGEILPVNIMTKAETAPAIIIDLSDVIKYHAEPEKLADIISSQAGFMVFDIATVKGRKACASHSSSIIKCIAPVINVSKGLAEEAKKVINKDLYFRKTFESCVREVAAYHRKPLTEYEDEQKRIADELERVEVLRIEEERYQNDWLSALDMDELFKLRKAKAEAEELARAEAKAIADKSEFERLVAARLESERLTIEAEARRKAEAEYMAKIEAESAKIRAEEQAKINEERRLEQIKVDEKAKIDRADFDARCLRNKKELQDQIDLAELSKNKKPFNGSDAARSSSDGPKQTLPSHRIEMVSIPKSEYTELLRRVEWLECLEACGVDNWVGFEDAKEQLLELS